MANKSETQIAYSGIILKRKERENMTAPDLVKMHEKTAGTVVEGYKKIEEAVVVCFNRMADWFVDRFLKKEDETCAEARARLEKEYKIER